MKRVRSFIGILLFLGVASFVVFQIMNVTTTKTVVEKNTKTTKSVSTKLKKVRLVAIGDSLTEGVGDSSSRGGYVPLVAELLEGDKKQPRKVTTSNYGVSGDRSDQILKRIKADKELQKDVTKADVVVLTVGGNDLMKVVKKELLNVNEKSFVQPEKDYQEEVKTIFSELRKLNKNAPIFVFGIYNPFYLYFSDIAEMQEVVTSWNGATESVVKDEQAAYFIPINDLLYKGDEDEQGVTLNEKQTKKESTAASEKIDSTIAEIEDEDDLSALLDSSDVVNNLLFEGDHFHPNDLGYQIMAQALYEKMLDYPKAW